MFNWSLLRRNTAAFNSNETVAWIKFWKKFSSAIRLTETATTPINFSYRYSSDGVDIFLFSMTTQSSLVYLREWRVDKINWISVYRRRSLIKPRIVAVYTRYAYLYACRVTDCLRVWRTSIECSILYMMLYEYIYDIVCIYYYINIVVYLHSFRLPNIRLVRASDR